MTPEFDSSVYRSESSFPQTTNALPVLTALFLILCCSVTVAQRQNPCAPCELPCALSPTDTLMDAYLTGGRVIRNVRSVRREVLPATAQLEQAVRLFVVENGRCRDTMIRVGELRRLEYGGVGALGAPRSVSILPAREFQRSETHQFTPDLNFLEFTPFAGYGGADESIREIGFESGYYGLEVLAAPFGALLGEKASLALGGGALIEGGRVRLPVMAQIRISFTGAPHQTDVAEFVPGPCAFGCGDAATVPDPTEEGFEERVTVGEKDSTVILVRDQQITEQSFRPFLFAEVGTLFDGPFDGSGSDDAINPDDRFPYLFGAGAGAPIGNNMTLSIAYRHMQLHLMTPCEGCPDRSIINTNRVHSILLKLGGRLSW